MKDFQYGDIESVQDLFVNYTERRIRYMLRYREPREIARLALNKTFRWESEAITALKEYFEDEEVAAPTPPTCDCPPANGLRWDTMPVRWAYNPHRQDLPNSVHLIRENWKAIEEVCGFKAFETAEANANIVITNEPLDGRGGTLGQAYQPSSGQRMAACGPMCGNIIIDSGEIWTRDFYQTVMLHEQLHAIGLPHSKDRESVMYPSYDGPKTLSSGDIAELLRRYPLNPIT